MTTLHLQFRNYTPDATMTINVKTVVYFVVIQNIA